MNRLALPFRTLAWTGALALASACQSAEPPPTPNPPQLGDASACSNVPTCNGPNLPTGCVFGAGRCVDGVNTCGPILCPDAGSDGGPVDASMPVESGVFDADVSPGCDAGSEGGGSLCNAP